MMATPRTGLSKRDVKLLRVRTNWFEVLITGSPTHPTVEQMQLLQALDGRAVFAGNEVKALHDDMVVTGIDMFSAKSLELREWDAESIVPTFFEQQDYQLYIFSRSADVEVGFRHENASLQQAITKVRDDQWGGRLNFRNEVGFSDLYITVNGVDALLIRLEVFPAKLDYRRDYLELLAEVNEEIYNLSFDFLRRTYQHMSIAKQTNPSLAEFITILRHLFEQLETAMERIDRHPHHRLRSESVVREASKVRRAGRENIAFLSRRTGVLERVVSGSVGFMVNGVDVLPRKLLETRRVQDYDTAENRFLRWVLRRIAKKLLEFQRVWRAREREASEELDAEIGRMRQRIERWLRLDWLQEVKELRTLSLTLVLQLAPGYRELYRIYLLLMKGLSIHSDMLRMSMKDLAKLYEYWCFLKINRLLRDKYELLAQNVVRANRGGLVVTLEQARSAKLKYRNRQTGEQFSLYYNALPEQASGNSPTVGQQPDTVFSLEKHGSGVVYHFVFDAKYRLNPAVPGDSYTSLYGSPGPEEDTINAMHRYRDAIVAHDRESDTYQRIITGAFVLFPYADEEQFEAHHFYKSIRKVSVGAIPFLPQATRLMVRFLQELVEGQ